ncbi:hypothetical protein Pcinc_036838 [Petrolisthes cinctipes]|uniref:Uncharacterized protein n=1 Tax=Petrolisthes cinctipes TaxID=88211 RepID=A0AAE1ELZ7_PETCI|nr:hypothetical protein Pcinc_036838 [Petrolisthes cinctipes]
MAEVRGRVLVLCALCVCFCVVYGQQSTPRHGTAQYGQGGKIFTTSTTTTTSPFTQKQQLQYKQQFSGGGREVGKHHKPQTATDDGGDEHQKSTADSIDKNHQQHPEDSRNDDSPKYSSERQMTETQNTTTTTTIPATYNGSKSRSPAGNSEGAPRESASKRTVAAPQTKAQQLRSPPSLAGTLLLLLISLVIAGSLFVMLLCFLHKWRENMGPGRYPRVVYSMLRQSEEEPEDVLGEILINIGLADPVDFTQPPTPSSTSSTPSPQHSDHQLDLGIDVPCFTTVPLRTDEAAISLLHPGPEESDEDDCYSGETDEWS